MLIIAEVDMVMLAIFSNIAKQLIKAKDLEEKNSIIFGKLSIVIFIGDLY